VARLITAPFWAVNSVGILSLEAHRLAFAARAECGPWGRLSSKLLKGASGVALKVFVVIPFLIWVLPMRSIVMP
jgi:hypothetical protein